MQNAASPEAYLESLAGWRQDYASALRTAVRSAASLEERLKWGHLVYFSNGPALLIRAESERVLFGFWRGQRLRHIEPRLKPGGKYEMATLEIRAHTHLERESVVCLVSEAVRLNLSLGDPTDLHALKAASAA
jgi:hypothetical protein